MSFLRNLEGDAPRLVARQKLGGRRANISLLRLRAHHDPARGLEHWNWRKRLGDRLELLLAESMRLAHEAGALGTRDIKRVTVDTTVQPKNVTFPTDAKLLHGAIKSIVRLAKKHGVPLRQSYLRVAKHAAMMAARYAHAKQFKRYHRQLRLLRTRLGRIIRDIRRKIAGATELEAAFERPLARVRADPLAAVAPARVEALFLPRPRGRMHRQGQSQRALRFNGMDHARSLQHRRGAGLEFRSTYHD